MSHIPPRRTPLSQQLVTLVRGSTFGDGGALRGIDDALARQLRTSDPVASRALRPLVTARMLRRPRFEWCLWIENLTLADISHSPFLSERVERVRAHRRTVTPPWLYERSRHPVAPRYAVALRQPGWLSHVIAFELTPEVIIDASLAAIDDLTTVGVIMSRPYRIWADHVRKNNDATVSVSPSTVHNTFPCPDLNNQQRQEIEDAAGRVFIARNHGIRDSLDELYSRNVLPPGLQRAHDDLDAIMCQVIGVDVDSSDDEVRSRLVELYSLMSAAA